MRLQTEGNSVEPPWGKRENDEIIIYDNTLKLSGKIHGSLWVCKTLDIYNIFQALTRSANGRTPD